MTTTSEVSEVARRVSRGPMRVAVVEGNGIGPEITAATQRVLQATGLVFDWMPVLVGEGALARHGHPLPQESVRMMQEIGLVLKGPLIVEKLKGRVVCRHDDGSEHVYPSLNNALRRELRLFVNPRPLRGMGACSGRWADLDIVIMREVTEDVYAGLERAVGEDRAEAIKLTTRAAAQRVARYSFEFARRNGRKRVTCAHKANVLGLTDGLFLRCCREVALEYPEVVFDDCMIDAAAYALVKTPERFDVIVTSNQYGDILSDLGAGLVGSLGLAPGANIGEAGAMFEASHGAAPDIAGRGIANPIALILSGALLLRHVGALEEAKRVEGAVRAVVIDGRTLTPDLGGSATTEEITDAICAQIEKGAA
jgi:isocitrate dehydrogenase (NAD+)